MYCSVHVGVRLNRRGVLRLELVSIHAITISDKHEGLEQDGGPFKLVRIAVWECYRSDRMRTMNKFWPYSGLLHDFTIYCKKSVNLAVPISQRNLRKCKIVLLNSGFTYSKNFIAINRWTFIENIWCCILYVFKVSVTWKIGNNLRNFAVKMSSVALTLQF